MKDEVQRVVISLPATADYVDIVRLNLYGVASKIGFSYEEIEDMKVAVSEACNNSVLYAYKQEPGIMEVTFEVHKDALSITVKDEGESFDSWGIAADRASLHDKELSEAQIGGLGFYLMEALMDDVSVESAAGQGTKVVLTRRLVKSEEKV
ncbi:MULTISPECIES: anti-sigma B factor RsbW [Paenibacillus]|uniref:Anti-sigma B factor RsbW n=1 Tax=Paenibacillus woosongensis TaxID=307580 RepID=A0A7X2Z331_9BACL|nr:anti-sigma B factor RsbW [Paenibacillus woosongensis]MUG46612.1 anti-sigma B factor RsbW [Paenibacillus woosongensis]GIP60327.1 serine-protein kinase RsbW [Paenibacillus woosongensis]